MPLLFLQHVVDNDGFVATPLKKKKKEANGNSGAKEFYHHQNFMRDGLDVWKKQPLEPLEERQTLTTPQLEP